MSDASLLAFALGAAAGGGLVVWFKRKPRLKRRSRKHLLDPPEQQLRDWLEEVAQGWLLINGDNLIASLNPRAEVLLELEDSGLVLR